MKKFLLGVLTGMMGTLVVWALLSFAVMMVDARGLDERPYRKPPQPIVLRGFFGGHGEFGVIEEISDYTITLVERDGDKQKVVVGDDAEIYRGKTKISLSELNKGERIVVIATTQADGTLKAKLIRVVSASLLINHEIPRNG